MYIAGLATLPQTKVFPTFSQSDFFLAERCRKALDVCRKDETSWLPQ